MRRLSYARAEGEERRARGQNGRVWTHRDINWKSVADAIRLGCIDGCEVPEEETGRLRTQFHSTPEPSDSISEPICFLLSFCTHHKAARFLKGVYANALDPAPANRMKIE